ncbi:hypothetical protein AB0H00_22430 [Nocardia sp. NPDC023852]|uniref:DUF6924 domain-containing protein n=1 Tax=Nocardia sp. NPDC023852 TaxID=3154697 RepID=UPI0033DA3DB2
MGPGLAGSRIQLLWVVDGFEPVSDRHRSAAISGHGLAIAEHREIQLMTHEEYIGALREQAARFVHISASDVPVPRCPERTTLDLLLSILGQRSRNHGGLRSVQLSWCTILLMARSLPEGESLLLRTDFTDDAAWAQTLAAVIASYDEDTMTGLTPIDDAAFDGLTPDELVELVDGQTYVFLADATTMTDSKHPILAVDTSDEDGPSGYPVFRIAPSAIAEVEVNFLLSNMDFGDFADNVDDDGVFCGFNR